MTIVGRGLARAPVGGGTTVLIDSLEVALVDQDISVTLTTGVSVELSPATLTVELAPAASSVTLDAGLSVTLDPDLEIDLG